MFKRRKSSDLCRREPQQACMQRGSNIGSIDAVAFQTCHALLLSLRAARVVLILRVRHPKGLDVLLHFLFLVRFILRIFPEVVQRDLWFFPVSQEGKPRYVQTQVAQNHDRENMQLYACRTQEIES